MDAALREKILDRKTCQGCGGNVGLGVHLVVASEEPSETNCVLLCRACAIRRRLPPTATRFPFDLFLTEEMLGTLDNQTAKYAQGSRAVYLRTVVETYLQAPESFGDLALLQVPSGPIRVHLYFDREVYERFRAWCEERGLTLSEALRAMIAKMESAE